MVSMEIVGGIGAVRQAVRKARGGGLSVGFVPTMGYLHDGHAALIRRARAENGFVAVSLFVNPLQFGPREDYRTYPRDLERDARLSADAGADLLFVPDVAEMYPAGAEGQRTFVEVAGLSDRLCGASRPGHFRGVATVVTKLLHIVAPDRAYFGQKDAQQLLILRRLVRDLDFDVDLVAVPTVREAGGLAMSSRNTYLSPEERRSALALYRALEAAEALLAAGERRAEALRARMREVLSADPAVQTDYAAAVDPETLDDLEHVADRVLLAVAARVGRARLIDNLYLVVDGDRVLRSTL